VIYYRGKGGDRVSDFRNSNTRGKKMPLDREKQDLAAAQVKVQLIKEEMWEVMKMVMDADEASLPSFGYRKGHAEALKSIFTDHAAKIAAVWKEHVRKYPD
jgi:hypothetical protein